MAIVVDHITWQLWWIEDGETRWQGQNWLDGRGEWTGVGLEASPQVASLFSKGRDERTGTGIPDGG